MNRCVEIMKRSPQACVGVKVAPVTAKAGASLTAHVWCDGMGIGCPTYESGDKFEGYCPNTRRSAISCWRNGILSIERESSRTLQGAGLRNATRPSLPISAIMYPRGRRAVRSSVSADGSVSVMMITSRSARSSKSASKRSICCWNLGSLGVSANTTKGRATHCRSSLLISAASNTWVRSSSQRSSTVVAWACRLVAAKTLAAAAKRIYIIAFIISDIEAALAKAKAQGQNIAKNFVMVRALTPGV